MNESTLNNFEDFYKKINPKMNEDSASCLIGITMETEGAKDFYKGEGGSRKKIAEQFPFPALRKRTKLGGALVSQGGYRTMVKNLIKKHGGGKEHPESYTKEGWPIYRVNYNGRSFRVIDEFDKRGGTGNCWHIDTKPNS